MTNTALIPSASSIEIQFINNQSVISSKALAEHFGKQHKNVLQKIEQLKQEIESAEWYELNFKPIQIDVDLGQGRTRQDTAYAITRDGFTLLAMGFTGKRALRWKIAYIEAFNRMERELINQTRPAQSPRKVLIDYPISSWTEMNPWMVVQPLNSPPIRMDVTASALMCADYRSPTRELLDTIKRNGVNVAACEQELSILRILIGTLYDTLLTSQKAAGDALATRFQLGLN